MSEHRVEVIDPAWIPLADGTRLCARIWLPENALDAPVPAILEYLPYRKDDVTAADDARMYPYFAARGYACARVDIRGSGDSDGLLEDEYSRQEQDDALEVIAWLATQPWCTGAVGMMGISWSGFNSLQVAARRPPALRAIISACSTDDRYDNDVHYYGGVPLGYYLLPWASAMMSFNVRPPDPAIVGERWREMWLRRLDGNVDLIHTWIEHQARDDYWRQGSICEDYSAITAATFLVGGWADAYVDAIFRMLGGLSCPRLGLIGPWGHQWPQDGRPGPAVGFLQEALRWWDHWLKGADTRIMDEPMVRAWMQEPVPPQSDYEERPGRWIAEPSWPPATPRQSTLNLSSSGELTGTDEATKGQRTHRSPQTVGIDAGAWCAYGNPADLPLDQRRDDALSLTFDSDPITERLEILGQPTLKVTVSSDRAQAFVMVRLCDVAPDGGSTLITRGALNLCHRDGHELPVSLEPGTAVEVTIALKSVAYALVPGHRIRLALSTSYWPWLWPSPAPVTLTVATGGASELRLPVRSPRPEDLREPGFAAPEHASELPITRLRDRHPEQLFTHDVLAGVRSLRMRRDFVGARRLPSGLEYHDHDPVTFSIAGDDPLSARVQCERRIELRRGEEWRTRIELRSTMTADADAYQLHTVIDAYEHNDHVHTRTFASTIPRNHS